MARHRRSIRDEFPLRLLIGGEDLSFLLGEGFTFSSTDPGGYEAASFPIPKDLPQIQRGDPVLLTCGLRTAWEGRVKEPQRSLGNRTLLQCEGNRAILKENRVAEIFCDRDLGKWQGPTLREQVKLIPEGYNPQGPTALSNPVSGSPALATQGEGAWVLPGNLRSEGWYDSNGVPLGVLYSAWERGVNVNSADTKWNWGSALSDDDLRTATDNSYNARSAGPGGGYLEATTATRVFGQVGLFYSTEGGGAQGVLYAIYWSNLAVYGRHGLTRRGSDPGGFYPSDIGKWVAEKCPGVDPGTIGTASEAIIPHSAYLAAVPYEQIINDAATYAAWHWGVWESLEYLGGSQVPRVDFRERPRAGQPTAWCWRKDCDSLDLRETLDGLYNAAVVSYNEPGGGERSVRVTLASAALTEAGLTREVGLSLGTGTKAAAEAWGLEQLELLADSARVGGTAQILEPVHLPGGGTLAPWLLKPGIDRLRIPDLPCADAWGEHNDMPITRMECTGTSTGIMTSLEFGQAANLVETLAARTQALITAAG